MFWYVFWLSQLVVVSLTQQFLPSTVFYIDAIYTIKSGKQWKNIITSLILIKWKHDVWTERKNNGEKSERIKRRGAHFPMYLYLSTIESHVCMYVFTILCPTLKVVTIFEIICYGLLYVDLNECRWHDVLLWSILSMCIMVVCGVFIMCLMCH